MSHSLSGMSDKPISSALPPTLSLDSQTLYPSSTYSSATPHFQLRLHAQAIFALHHSQPNSLYPTQDPAILQPPAKDSSLQLEATASVFRCSWHRMCRHRSYHRANSIPQHRLGNHRASQSIYSPNRVRGRHRRGAPRRLQCGLSAAYLQGSKTIY